MKIIILALFLVSNSIYTSEHKHHHKVTIQQEKQPEQQEEVSCIIKSQCVRTHRDKLIYGTTGSILGFLVMLIIHFQYTC